MTKEETGNPQILFLVRGHKDFYEDEVAQAQTWAKENARYQTFWVHGNENVESPMLKDRQILIPLSDSRPNMLAKVIEALKFSLNISNPELVVLTTTNTYFNIPRVLKALQVMKRRDFQLAGHLEQWSHRDPTNIMKGQLISKGDLFINGASMLLREQAFRLLTKIHPGDYIDVPDDLAISYHFKEVQIPWIHVPRNNLYSSHFFVPRYAHRVKGINNKKHTSQRIILIHNIYSSSSFYRKCLAYFRLQIIEIARVPLKRILFPSSYLKRLAKRSFI